MADKVVLMLGVSTLWLTEPGAPTLVALVEQELRARSADAEWRAALEPLYLAPNMASRARASIERNRPDAVLLCLGAHQFADVFSVGLKLRQRWPRLHAVIEAMVRPFAWRFVKRNLKVRDLLDRLFRLPHKAARRVIGAEPVIPRENAMVFAQRTIDAIEGSGTPWVCGLVGRTDETKTPERRELVRAYKAELSEYLEARGVPHYDIEVAAAQAGYELRLLPDNFHLTLASRQFEAGVVVDLMLRAIAAHSTQQEATEAR
jgi:hypothetical protein